MSDHITIRFDKDGLQSVSGDYLSGLDTTVSYSSDSCTIRVSGTVTSYGTSATVSGTYNLTKNRIRFLQGFRICPLFGFWSYNNRINQWNVV